MQKVGRNKNFQYELRIAPPTPVHVRVEHVASNKRQLFRNYILYRVYQNLNFFFICLFEKTMKIVPWIPPWLTGIATDKGIPTVFTQIIQSCKLHTV